MEEGVRALSGIPLGVVDNRFTVKLDDFLDKLNGDVTGDFDYRAGRSLVHQFGHVEGTLKNLPHVLYFHFLYPGDKETTPGHEPGNPSGENVEKREKEFNDAYRNRKRR